MHSLAKELLLKAKIMPWVMEENKEVCVFFMTCVEGTKNAEEICFQNFS